MDGFKSGIPPTVAMLIKKNAIAIKIKQNPTEYMSFLLKCMMFSQLSFRKCLGRIPVADGEACECAVLHLPDNELDFAVF